MKKNIIFLLGTKAQFIKTIPVINSVNEEKYNIFLYDTAQHRDVTTKQLPQIKNNFEHIYLSNNSLSANNLKSIFIWFISACFRSLKKISRFNLGGEAICVVHGNTLSSLIGLIWAKVNKIKILHIEGGYRTFNFFKPFPEEIIRYVVSKFSDYVVCFDKTSFENLENMKIKGQIVRISRNTIFDTIDKKKQHRFDKSKLIVSIHRNENIFNKKTLEEFVDFLLELKLKYFENIFWYMHPQTRKQIKKNSFEKKLMENEISVLNIVNHDSFINEIFNSGCVITDGESVIEECSIIGVPTYVLLNKLENKSSINKNIFISKYDHSKNHNFFLNLEDYIVNKSADNEKPSDEIYAFINKKIF